MSSGITFSTDNRPGFQIKNPAHVLIGYEDGFKMEFFGFDRRSNVRASALPQAVEFL
jgi:hypothetical protein